MAANCDDGTLVSPTRLHSGKRPAGRGRSSKSARNCSRRRSRRIWRPARKGAASIRDLLRSGLEFWRESSDVVLVEGAGGLMSPVSDDDYNADLADEFGYPLVVVAANVLGTINATLQTLDRRRHIPRGPRDRGHRAQFAARRRRTIPAPTATPTNWRGGACRRCWRKWSTAAASIADVDWWSLAGSAS